MRRRGIVALADEHYFPGLMSLYQSIWTSWPCPIVCYDIGMTDAQRRQANESEGLMILDLPDDPLISDLQKATQHDAALAKPGKRIWPLWICPLLIRAAPFDDVFWLDCDIIVLRGLHELFLRLENGPVFTPENKAPDLTPNHAELYDHLPIHRKFEHSIPTVNGGVSGWRKDRDSAALAAYILPIEAAVRDRRIMDLISWHDQGALIWAIQSLGLERFVLSTPLSNFSADHLAISEEIMTWDKGLCERLRQAVPDVQLLHWNGRKPPWMA